MGDFHFCQCKNKISLLLLNCDFFVHFLQHWFLSMATKSLANAEYEFKEYVRSFFVSLYIKCPVDWLKWALSTPYMAHGVPPSANLHSYKLIYLKREEERPREIAASVEGEGRRKYLSNDITATEWKCYPFIAMFSPSATFLGRRTLLLLPSFPPTARRTRPRSVTQTAGSRGRRWRRAKGESGW